MGGRAYRVLNPTREGNDQHAGTTSADSEEHMCKCVCVRVQGTQDRIWTSVLRTFNRQRGNSCVNPDAATASRERLQLQ